AEQGAPGARADHRQQQGWARAGRKAHRREPAGQRLPAASAPAAVVHVAHGRHAMTAEEPAARPAPVGWVLRLGARAAFASVLPLLALGAVLAIGRAAWSALWPAFLQADPSLRLHGTLFVSGLGLLVLASVARAVVLAVAVQAGAARVRSGSARPEISPERA